MNRIEFPFISEMINYLFERVCSLKIKNFRERVPSNIQFVLKRILTARLVCDAIAAFEEAH